MARPGTLIRPTNVAAVICQALSPALSHEGYASHSAVPKMDISLHFLSLNAFTGALDRPGRQHPSVAHHETGPLATAIGRPGQQLAPPIWTYVETAAKGRRCGPVGRVSGRR